MPQALAIFIKPPDDYGEIQPQNLYKAIELFNNYIQQEIPIQGKNISNQVITAVYRYTLPGWGFPLPKGKKLTQLEKNAGDEFAKQVSLEQCKDILNIQQQVFEKFQISNNIQRNYKAHLKKLFNFCNQHQWWELKPCHNSTESIHHQPLCGCLSQEGDCLA